MIGLLKSGVSKRHPAIRAAELSSSTGVPAPFTVELFLDVTDRYKAEAAYRRTDLFDRRRRLMEDWAAYLTG